MQLFPYFWDIISYYFCISSFICLYLTYRYNGCSFIFSIHTVIIIYQIGMDMWESCHSRIDNENSSLLQIYAFPSWEATLNSFYSFLFKFGFLVFYRDLYYTSFNNVSCRSCRQTPNFYLERWPVQDFYLADKSFSVTSLFVACIRLNRYT